MTIRALMLAQQERHPESRYGHWCYACHANWPCPERVAADAALATLAELRERLNNADDALIRAYEARAEPELMPAISHVREAILLLDPIIALASDPEAS